MTNAPENSLCGLLTEGISPGWRGAQRPPDQSLGPSILFPTGDADLHCGTPTVVIP